jgi:hypothetical protein
MFALYAVALVNVMLNHWLPSNLKVVPLRSWAAVAVPVFRADKALMGAMFACGGVAAAKFSPKELFARAGVLFAIYVVMGWPSLSSTTAGISSFHRWFLLEFVVALLLAACLHAGNLPIGPSGLALLGLAPLFGGVPDKLGTWIVGHKYETVHDSPLALVLNPWQYWSLGHKIYWMGLFLLGCRFGTTVLQALLSVTKNRGSVQVFIIRVVALVGAGMLAFVQIHNDVPYDGSLHATLADWPQFFVMPQYPLKVCLELTQLGFLVIGLGQGNFVLRSIGGASLATFFAHMYVNLNFLDFIQSKYFASFGETWPFGGVAAQFALLFAYPVCFGMVVGPLLTQLALFLWHLKVDVVHPRWSKTS